MTLHPLHFIALLLAWFVAGLLARPILDHWRQLAPPQDAVSLPLPQIVHLVTSPYCETFLGEPDPDAAVLPSGLAFASCRNGTAAPWHVRLIACYVDGGAGAVSLFVDGRSLGWLSCDNPVWETRLPLKPWTVAPGEVVTAILFPGATSRTARLLLAPGPVATP